jgi:methylated-DNA-[protein]-cysteine S-methyltransferase
MSAHHRQAHAFHTIDTPLGSMLLAADGDALIGAWFTGQKDYPDTAGWYSDPSVPVLQQAAQEPVRFAWGTAFQRAVWAALLEVGHGQTCSYGDIARRIAKPNAVRAVGAAIGKNPISVLVPCHRVVGHKGSLTGYAGGLDRKRALLSLEHAV